MLPIFCLALIASVSCFEPKIIGGESTTIDKYPYQVSIHYNGKHSCGGSLISNQWILTAAHCVYGGTMTLFKIRVGSSYHEKEGILIDGITTIYYHEMYDEDTYNYDVALIKLPTPLKLGTNIKSIGLATSSTTIKTGYQAVITGWGKTSTTSPNAKILQSLTVPVFDQEMCKKIYGRYGIVTPVMLCAGYTTGGKDSCHGDSGGPLVYNGLQIGIVSWGAQCGSVGFPGVYTRIPSIRSWITQKANV